MDFMMSIINRTPEKINHLIDEISKSNMPKESQFDLIDILHTVLEQIDQSREMGFL